MEQMPDDRCRTADGDLSFWSFAFFGQLTPCNGAAMALYANPAKPAHGRGARFSPADQPHATGRRTAAKRLCDAVFPLRQNNPIQRGRPWRAQRGACLQPSAGRVLHGGPLSGDRVSCIYVLYLFLTRAIEPPMFITFGGLGPAEGWPALSPGRGGTERVGALTALGRLQHFGAFAKTVVFARSTNGLLSGVVQPYPNPAQNGQN